MSKERALDEERIRVVRLGNGANCSSIGSVVDTLFATAAVGGAVLAGIVAALAREEVRVAGAPDEKEPDAPPKKEDDA